jgi:phosphatidylinositol alpha-1,6-mannosyltransferase
VKVLLVTNDFPPRPGGIQSFLGGLADRLPANEVVVYTSRWRGWRDHDAALGYPVIREDTSVLLPTPGVRRRAVALAAEHGCDAVWFGAAVPLALMAPALRRAGVQRIVATTHGHEAGWTNVPGGAQMLRRIAARVDVLTYLGDYTYARLAGALGPYADRLRRLAPGVDTELFRPGLGHDLRARLGLASRPVIVCVSRLMPRKGQDQLVRVLPALRAQVPETALLLVGGGPGRGRVEQLAKENGIADAVVVTGSVPWSDLPAYYGSGDVFAMPCRTRLGGFDVEGLGIVFLEAAACGLAVVAGDSGGAPETVRDGNTGYVVNGRDGDALLARLVELLADPTTSAAMGARGRAGVEEQWSWARATATLADLLAEPPNN